MGMRVVERAILSKVREVFNNSKLKLADIQEWSTEEVKTMDDEVTVYLPTIGVHVSVKKTSDKRKSE